MDETLQLELRYRHERETLTHLSWKKDKIPSVSHLAISLGSLRRCLFMSTSHYCFLAFSRETPFQGSELGFLLAIGTLVAVFALRVGTFTGRQYSRSLKISAIALGLGYFQFKVLLNFEFSNSHSYELVASILILGGELGSGGIRHLHFGPEIDIFPPQISNLCRLSFILVLEDIQREIELVDLVLEDLNSLQICG